MGLMDGGRKKSMGVFTVGRLARLLLVLTSSNITEIMLGLMSWILTFSRLVME